MIDYEASFVNNNGVAFPDTEAVNVSAPGAGDGTEFVKLLVDDVWGRAQALLDYAGMVPDGVSEAAGTAQIMEALSRGFGIGPGIGVIYDKNDTPIAHGDRVLLKQGQVILIATYPLLVAATYCGNAANPTAPAFYKTSDAGGTIRDIAGAYMVLPDARGLGLKMLGNATINGRTKVGPTALGEKQEDQFQGFTIGSAGHPIQNSSASYTVPGGALRVPFESAGSLIIPLDDGTNGTPRTGVNTRDSSIGTNFGITY